MLKTLKKRMKTRCIKITNPLVKNKSISDINVLLTVNQIPLVFSETTPEDEKNKITNDKVQKFTNLLLKQLYSK